jgi:hypothetical protein
LGLRDGDVGVVEEPTTGAVARLLGKIVSNVAARVQIPMSAVAVTRAEPPA